MFYITRKTKTTVFLKRQNGKVIYHINLSRRIDTTCTEEKVVQEITF